MRVSVIIRTRNEADRLRLTLTSLACQTVAAEVVVVNDASVDHTAAVVAEARGWLPLRVVDHAEARGRAGATNAGVSVATGDILLFLDGDTLAHPELIARHSAIHADDGRQIARGETFHLRSTRFLRDPETATPRSGEELRLARLSADERARLRVTRADIMNDFTSIHRRAERGIYPGSGPRRLCELEMDALRHHPDCSVLWAAAAGSNLSVRRDDFLDSGGFHEDLDINEHRELALRLCASGARMVPADGARTYHMTHRSGWRDPLVDTTWEEVFYRAHPLLAVKLLNVFWATLAGKNDIPAAARITSLPDLEVASRGDRGIDYDAIRRLIPGLPELPAVAAGSAATRGERDQAAGAMDPR
jgi:glycosyltransferase involved in cell wall biosynthesis